MKINCKLSELDTPALLVDINIMKNNLIWGQGKADKAGVKLRPHTKTHRTPNLAKKQVELGAKGITVAKTGEAEVMADAGIDDIFIANEVVGEYKLERIFRLNQRIRIALGVDHFNQAKQLSAKFAGSCKPIEVMIDIDTGDARTGVKPGNPTLSLTKDIIRLPGIKFRGIFTHDGHSYGAKNIDEVQEIFKKSQQDMLQTANLLRNQGIEVNEISIGSTPSFLVGDIFSGITEIRPGTYIFMDVAQGNLLKDFERCALTVLATVTNRPTLYRVVVDAGTKSLTAFIRGPGVCQTKGHGLLKSNTKIHLESLSDEHGVFTAPSDQEYPIGNKLQIIPNHACPTCNLYDYIYGIDYGNVVDKWKISARGKSQ